MSYRTPIRDFRFALKHMASFDALAGTGAYDDLSDDLVDAILEEMARFCDEVVVLRGFCPASSLAFFVAFVLGAGLDGWPWLSGVLA